MGGRKGWGITRIKKKVTDVYDYAKMKLVSFYDNPKYVHIYDLENTLLELMRNENSCWAGTTSESSSSFLIK